MSKIIARILAINSSCIFTGLFACIAVTSFAQQSQSVSTASKQPSTPTAAKRKLVTQYQSLVWLVPRFSYRAESKRLAEVLQDFSASQGLPIVLAEGIDGVVQGNFNTEPEEFLNAMSKAYGLLWYHDGTALYVYPSQAYQSRIFRLKDIRRSQITALLKSMQLDDRRYPLRFDESNQTLFASGPPRHIELIVAAIEQLNSDAGDLNRNVVRVVPLRYASAGDRTSGQTRIPGLASILGDLYSRGVTPQLQNNEDIVRTNPTSSKARPLLGLTGSDRSLADVFTRGSDDKNRRSNTEYSSKSSSVLSPLVQSNPRNADDYETPIFRADEGTNSILVFGRPQRLSEYVDLIKRLDLKPILVELEATIIDVSSDSVDSLGVTWQVQSAQARVGVTPSPTSGSTPFQISTLWANAGRELLSRIDALTANGKASVIARPKLLGVANRPAVMKEKRVVAVKVTGSFEANLFQLEVGTLLQMTPYVISADGESRIRLSIYIEDGSFEDTVVDGVPSLKRMEISTEAHMLEGESLLIGGITTSVDASQSNGVPGLSKLPLFGGLFRSTNDKRQRSERMFLITPRVIRDIARLPAQPEVRSLQISPELRSDPLGKLTQ
jgi:type III secretion protein C